MHRALVAFALALAIPAPAAALRPDTPGTDELFRYAPEDIVDHHDSASGSFRIHFTRMGASSVPALDADVSGIPDHVERIAEIYDEVLAFYRDELGFREPLDDGAIVDGGGDARFDVYLLDFGGRADGSFRADRCDAAPSGASRCVGFVVQENDFAGYAYPSVDYANRLLASHELFHAVQAAYDASENTAISEGTAVWASESFDPSLRDLEVFSGGYLERTDRPLDTPLPGPVDPFSYGVSLFFRFLEERFDRELLRALWEASEEEGEGEWLAALDGVLAREHGSSFAAAFRGHAEWNLFTADRADASRSYEQGAAYAPLSIEAITLPHRAGALRVFHASAHYFGASPGSRGALSAALVGDTEGLELFLALRRGSAIELAGSLPIDVGDVDEVIVAVINAAIDGESRRPGLCVGAPSEVAACVTSFEPTPDAGPATLDAGVGEDGGAVAPAPSGGCSCSSARHDAPLGRLALFLVLGAALARRSVDRSARARRVRTGARPARGRKGPA